MTANLTLTGSKATPRRRGMDRDTAMRLAATEYDRFLSLLNNLENEQWARPTDCPAWDVRAMAGHVLGMTKMVASIRESMRQQKLAGRTGGLFIDGLTDLQVREHADLSTDELVAQFRVIGPKAARSRRRTPSFVRNRRAPQSQIVNGQEEWWTLGFLLDVVLTRDPWMHRVDISRAVGAIPELSADHDGVLIADVVAEWASRHGQPFDLTLTGPAGGSWTKGTAGERIQMDSLEFCRALSGRGADGGLLTTQVPF